LPSATALMISVNVPLRGLCIFCGLLIHCYPNCLTWVEAGEASVLE
jgi:hypothetical protein